MVDPVEPSAGALGSTVGSVVTSVVGVSVGTGVEMLSVLVLAWAAAGNATRPAAATLVAMAIAPNLREMEFLNVRFAPPEVLSKATFSVFWASSGATMLMLVNVIPQYACEVSCRIRSEVCPGLMHLGHTLCDCNASGFTPRPYKTAGKVVPPPLPVKSRTQSAGSARRSPWHLNAYMN